MSNRTRTNIDDFALRFMLSELNAKQFLNEYLLQFNNVKISILERLEVLKDYFDNNLHHKEFEDLQEIIIANIAIHPNKFKLEKLTPTEQSLYFDELKIDAIEQKNKELSELINTILPNYIKRYNKKDDSDEFDDGSISGFNYKGNFEYIVKFHKSLVRSGFIEVEYEDFKKFFKERFIPDEERIFWKESLNQLNYLIKKIANSVVKENIGFHFKRNNYLDIIPYMFEYEDEITKKRQILSKHTYSQNNKKPNKEYIDLLDKALQHIL